MREATAMRSPTQKLESSPHSPQPKKAHMQPINKSLFTEGERERRDTEMRDTEGKQGGKTQQELE